MKLITKLKVGAAAAAAAASLSVTSVAPVTLTAAGASFVAGTALLAADSAEAQRGKRVCGTSKRGNMGVAAGFMVEVSKHDFVTCSGIVATYWSFFNFSTSGMGAIRSMLMGNVGDAMSGSRSTHFMATCEAFTRETVGTGGFWGNNVCHHMRDYTNYAWARGWGISNFGRF